MNVLRLVPPQGDSILVTQDRVLVGRDGVCDVHLRDASVSRQHAEIRKTGEDWIIEDLGSGNGVLVDGTRVRNAVLAAGQEVQLGSVRFRVEIDRGSELGTMIIGRADALDATLIQRHAPSHPEAALANLRGERRVARSPAPTTAPTTRRSRAPMVMAGLFFAGVALLVSWRLSRQPKATGPTAVVAAHTLPTATPEPSAVPITASAALPTLPEPVAATPAPRRGLLLVTADERSQLAIDGLRQTPLTAGEMRRVEVVPGEHLLSFDAGDGRRDQVVRAIADEQTVVRFSGSRAVASAPVTAPVATPVIPTQVAPTPAPTATSTPAPTTRPPAAPKARPLDEGLATGIAAAERGDFYRSLLVLKDATRRLDDDPASVQDLALANAYLAWTYHALDRVGEAVVAAQKAVRLDPSVTSRLNTFPPPVRALFNPTR